MTTLLRRYLGLLGLGAAVACAHDDQPTRTARDPALRQLPLLLYAQADSTRPPRAVVFFFGNDIGFWRPHRRLAASLARSQYAVAGFDVRPLLADLPEHGPPRDSVFADRIGSIITRARHELGGDAVPLVIAGHSIGAELALWTAAHAPVGHVAGVLALSPGSRGHLQVSVSDVMNGPEPTGPESFAIAQEVERLPACERVAIVRGTRDKLIRADAALLGAGGARATRFLVPLSGHSLKRLTTSGLQVHRALSWILDDTPE